MQSDHSDYCTIADITPGGKITCTEDFNYYHYGANSIGDVDMRGEVYLLTRNVEIFGHDAEEWGG